MRSTNQTNDIVAMARHSREKATAFRQTVERFGAEMPHSMERFHEAMKAFRTAAHALRTGPLLPIDLPAAPALARAA